MSDTRDTASLFLKVNSEEAKREFEAVKSKVDELKKKLIEASNAGDFKQVQELQKQLRPAIKEMNNALTKVGQIESAMKHLSLQSEKDLKKTKSLIISMMNEIPRGTKQWDEYNEKLKQVKAELKKLADEQKVVTDSGLSMKDMLDIGGNLSMIAASVLQVKDSVAEFMRDNVNSYIELDAEMANVQKFTGMTRQSVEELNEEFKEIDTRTSVVELNKLAEEAGRLGKTSKEDVLGFVKAADIINVALDDLGEGATLEISKLTSIFGDEKALGTEKSMLAVGSVINELSQNSTAAAPYLANFTKRLAGVGAQADMTIPQIMGFAAVLDSQGQAVEMSATAVSQLITKMFQDPAKIAKAVGIDVKEFTDMVKTDTNGALLTLLERLNAFGNMDVLAPIFKEMGTDGARASAVLASLAGNVDMVRQQQEVATEAYKEATSVVKEFSVQNETEEAKLEKKRKKLEEVKVALGEKLLPIMGGFTSTGTMMIKMLNALLDIFNKYKSTIITTGSAVLVYTGYLKAKNYLTAKEISLKKVKVFLQEKSVKLFSKMNTLMKNHKIGIVITAVTALVALFRDLSKQQEKANSAMNTMAEIEREADAAVKEETTQIRRLTEVVNNNNLSLDARRTALNKLQEIVPTYHASLTNEGILINNNSTALEQYVALLEVTKQQEIAVAKVAESRNAKDEWWNDLNEGTKRRYENAILAWQLDQSGGITGMEKPQWDNINQAAARAGMSPATFGAIHGKYENYDKEIARWEKASKELTAKMATIQADFEKRKKALVKGGGSGGGGDDAPKTEDKLKEEIKLAERAAKEKWVLQRSIEDAAYSRGEITYEEHIKRLQLAEQQYLDDCMAAYKQRNMTDEDGYVQLLDKKRQLLEKHNRERLNLDIEDLEREQQKEQQQVLEDCYDVNSILFGNEKVRDQRLFEINIDYLRRKAELYRAQAMSKEAHQIEQQIAQAEADEALRKQKEYAERLQQWRKEYSNTSAETQMKAELLTLDEMHKAGLVKEEEYQQLRKAIQEKYSKGGKFSDGGYGDMLTNMYTSIDAIVSGTTDKTISSMQKIGAVAQSTWAIAGAALEQYSAYSQACCDLEVSEIEKKYDKMIAAAGKNSTRSKQLEEKKEKEIAKVKTKYNKQAQKIEIAGAVAQTAVAAINAYASASKVNWILGPIAAAMALAAGSLQIATIQKQHQAQQAGYYGGGFTRKSANDQEEVGVVHANEFVANAEAVKNPYLSPFFSLVDYAQRNNTVGSITANDVSHAIGTGAVLRATSTTANETVQNSGELLAVAGSINSSAQVVQRLNDRLDEGIEAFVVMDGERGLDKKYSDYNRLKNNPKR